MVSKASERSSGVASVGCVARAGQPWRGRRNRFVRLWASGGAKFPKMWDSLPRTPMNHCAKFDTASFILGGEIRNRTNTKKTKKEKSTSVRLRGQPYIHTCWSYAHTPRDIHEQRICSVNLKSAHDADVHIGVIVPGSAPRARRFWASGGAKFSKMGDSLPRTPMKHRVKFDAASIYPRRRNP